nr:hypothetical protein [Halomicronema hongdechloris]
MGSAGIWRQLLQLAIASGLGLGLSILGIMALGIPEATQLAQRLRQRFFRRSRS